MKVCIRGEGVAAMSLARLLDIATISASRASAPRTPVPSIMLSAPALGLLRDVHGQSDLLGSCPKVTRRVVAWGGHDPVSLPHEAIIASEATIRNALEPVAASGDEGEGSRFTVFATDPLPSGEKAIFGESAALAVEVTLRGEEVHQECRVEALDSGWLFMLPGDSGRDAPDKGWLLAFGAAPEELLAQSRLVAPVVTLGETRPASFVTAPRMAIPLAGEDWLACGSAALGFDPICGDGTAQAVREAILAAAVIRGIEGGGDAEALLGHYRSMLVAAMRRHLQLCVQFYRTGGPGDWWQAQAAALERGYAVCTRMLAMMPEPQFVLRGFSLEPRAAAA